MILLLVFWDVTCFSLVGRYQFFRATLCFHPHSRRVTLMMEAADSSKILVPMYWTTWCHIPEQEDHILKLWCLTSSIPVMQCDVYITAHQVSMMAIEWPSLCSSLLNFSLCIPHQAFSSGARGLIFTICENTRIISHTVYSCSVSRNG